MSDSAAIEAIARGFYEADDAYLDTWESQPEEGVKDWYRNMARAGLAALRADGFEIYRPDECPVDIRIPYVATDDDGDRMGHLPGYGWIPAGTYRLVPVGDSPKETE